MTDRQAIYKMLRGASLRCTAGRMALLETLITAQEPLTQEQLGTELSDTDLNKTTIYRALESFVEAGLVHKAYFRERTWYYELACNCGKVSCHPHFTCKKCGHTQCLKDVRVPVVEGLQPGYVVERQKIELHGLCPDCHNSEFFNKKTNRE